MQVIKSSQPVAFPGNKLQMSHRGQAYYITHCSPPMPPSTSHCLASCCAARSDSVLLLFRSLLCMWVFPLVVPKLARCVPIPSLSLKSLACGAFETHSIQFTFIPYSLQHYCDVRYTTFFFLWPVTPPPNYILLTSGFTQTHFQHPLISYLTSQRFSSLPLFLSFY